MIQVINPATGTLITSIQEDDAAAIKNKVQLCHKAQKNWKNESYQDRIKIIQKFKQILEKNAETCANILTEEMGKPIKQAIGEIASSSERIDFFCSELESCLATQTVLHTSDWLEQISLEPLGVIANISAWNYPYFVGLNVIIPALLTGNGVCYKPSELTLKTGLQIANLLYEAGLPKDLFAVIIGGKDAGRILCDEDIQGVFFTGSLATGQAIARQVKHKIIPIGLELGGKDPVYVCDDVDPASIAPAIADGAFYNAGQGCCSVERLYVHKNIYKPFMEAFVSWTKSIKIGDPKDKSTYLGPLSRKEQIPFLQAQVSDALSKGAQLLVKGGLEHDQNKEGNFFAPVVLTHTNHSMDVMVEESFGPIIGIMEVSSDEEAIQLMNDSKYGLTASIYTKDKNRATKVLSQMEAGSVYWNACDRVSTRLPWTGWKNSGIGSTLSTIGIRSFTKPKAWHLRISSR